MVVKKKGATSGGKMKMVMKGGKMVPAFAADGVGKMGPGGAVGMHRAVKRKTADVKGRAMRGR